MGEAHVRDQPDLLPHVVARDAVLCTVVLYCGYAVAGYSGLPPTVRDLGLIVAFYWLPQWMLRHDPERQARYQVGPNAVVPRWSWRGAKLAAGVIAIVFPPFVVGFFVFYAHVCAGDEAILTPVTVVEGWVSSGGGLVSFLERLCRGHQGGLWPTAFRIPPDWLAYGGLGAVLAVAVEVFAVALPEEVFHRGYLMSALEERFVPKRTIFGARMGLAALLASVLFACGHLVGMLEVARLATFFPGLLFAWLWRRSGSLWAPTLVHAAANLLMAVLVASTFPR